MSCIARLTKNCIVTVCTVNIFICIIHFRQFQHRLVRQTGVSFDMAPILSAWCVLRVYTSSVWRHWHLSRLHLCIWKGGCRWWQKVGFNARALCTQHLLWVCVQGQMEEWISHFHKKHSICESQGNERVPRSILLNEDNFIIQKWLDCKP